MPSIKGIDDLKNYRDAITFVELACLLHDLGKCASEFAQSKLKDPAIKDYDHMQVLENDTALIEKMELKEFFEGYLAPVFLSTSASYIVKKWDLDQISIRGFVEKHERAEPKTKLIALMQIADRKDAADDRAMPLARQEKETYISSVFGREEKIDEEGLDEARKSFYQELSNVWKSYRARPNSQKLRKEVYDAFSKLKYALAETRRAANDVSLVDHSYATASIMKALLTWDVLEDFSITLQKLLPTHRHWEARLRVLGIGWNANRLFAAAQSLPGVAGRERLLDKVKGSIKDLLEYEIPVGNVIYEDQNSICFLVPENTHKIYDELKEQIIKRVDELTEGLITPMVELSDPNPYPNKVITKTIGRLRERITIPTQTDFIPSWTKQWNKVTHTEVCVQCGKKPRSEDEDICEFCLEMIRDGISDVLRKLTVAPSVYKETVWVDEVADENGNVALIYGLIPLEKWLDGTLLKTMRIKTIQDIKSVNQVELMKKLRDETKVSELFEDYEGLIRAVQIFEDRLENNDVEVASRVIHPFLDPSFRPRTKELLKDTYIGLCSRAEPQTPAGVLEVIMTKSPSPSRIRKVWVETQKFFENLSTETQSSIFSGIGDYCLRLKFKPKFSNEEEERRLKSMKYKTLEVEKIGFEIKLPKSDLFWDGEFMYTTIRLEHYALGKELRERQEHLRSLIEDVKSSGKIFATLKITDRKISIGIESYDFERYVPTRTILVSPYLFAVIVPGNLAIALLYNYLRQYEKSFCKVSDRLPFNTGILFFKRKFPLYVALDVMERFTKYLPKLSSETKTFKVIKRNSGKLLLEEVDTDKVKISRGDPWLLRYEWAVSDRLGGDADDLYHPNFIVKPDTLDIKSKDTYFELKIENPESLLNLKDIDPGILLKLYPSFFDFHFLKSSSERFNLFSSAGKRAHPILGTFGVRPYLLKDLKKIIELWNIINPENGRLTMSQIKKLEHMCLTKIEEWFKKGTKFIGNPADSEIYRIYLEASVKNICGGRLTPEEEMKLVQSILSGMFFDVVELFITLGSYIPREAERNE